MSGEIRPGTPEANFFDTINWHPVPPSNGEGSNWVVGAAAHPFPHFLDQDQALRVFGLDGPVIGLVRVGDGDKSAVDLLVDRRSTDPSTSRVEVVRYGEGPLSVREFWAADLPPDQSVRADLWPGQQVARSSEGGLGQATISFSADGESVAVSTASVASVAIPPELSGTAPPA